ncbi:monofunctional biosynthetic peptidoglycan transglycosylase [Hufsiella ginkgonis]|uniref:Biosynthetic peptidoglycan transglycosylase n=1 Tax=Hufsiella ginkgonis TaxID=2695274 RepID=A0A7K1XUH3_9SPHI|nr:monofunctional biosynthetic peptidoglycan transglycosylase [Hufsiella ginkgonis]MXV14661.1 monofunctional biosynthetic peptidoglycan transglycosylase [Hufsiella ginkgonis]
MPKNESTSKRASRSGISWRRAWKIAKRVMLIYFGATIFWVIACRFINPPVTWLMVSRGFERKFDGKPWLIRKDWLDYDSIPRNLKIAAMAGEDAKFLEHRGFDVESIEQAYEKNQQGKKIRGGSTITQQTAKNVFLWPGRSWIRKGFEVYFTVLIEVFWSKERTLEVYLNVIETGDGIYGVSEASRVYFHKEAQDLNRSEAALIVAVLPNPRKWSPANPTRYIYYKQGLILRNMRRLKKAKI